MASADASSSPSFTEGERVNLRYCLDDVRSWLIESIEMPLQLSLRIVAPTEVGEFKAKLDSLIGRIYTTHIPFEGSEEDLSILRRALLHRRYKYTAENESLRQKTAHAGILTQLQDRLVPIEKLMKQTWFSAGKPCGLPKLTDFLTIQEVYHLRKEELSPPAIEYDEKFGILISPGQFLPRLSLSRIEAGLRGTCVSVAFVDIDDFKFFNSNYGEFSVDRSVLPVFMRCLEAHVHSHGYAFRFGGDEYMLLLPNAEREAAIAGCNILRKSLQDLSYPGIDKTLSASMGICTCGPDSPLTDRELQQRATDAKQIAKKAGKNRVAWINGDSLLDSDAILA